MPFYVKSRHESEKRFSFLTSGGGTSYLRIHAARFESREKAQAFVDDIAPDNPDFELKIVQ